MKRRTYVNLTALTFLLLFLASCTDPKAGEQSRLKDKSQGIITQNTSVVNGLKATFYNGMALQGASLLERIDPNINVDFGHGNLATGVPSDQVSVRWTGYIVPRYSEKYTFSTISDDGTKVFINGQLVVNAWRDQGPTETIGTITLEAGKPYEIKVEYYENGGGAEARLYWWSASQSREIIPSSVLYPTIPPSTPIPPAPPIGDGLKGQYFDNMQQTGQPRVRVDKTVDFNWGHDGPFPDFTTERWSVKWIGWIRAAQTGRHTFYFTSDDGGRLRVNGALLIDKWVDQGTTTWQGEIDLESGKYYPIELDYYDNCCEARATLEWSNPQQTRQVVPQSVLFSSNPTPVAAPSITGVRFQFAQPDTSSDIWSGGRKPLIAWVDGINTFDPGLLWSVQTGGDVASLSKITTTSGEQIELITAYGLPQDKVVTIRVTSKADPNKFQDANVTVRAGLRINMNPQQAQKGPRWVWVPWEITQPYPGPLQCRLDFLDGTPNGNTGWFDCYTKDSRDYEYGSTGVKRVRLNVRMKEGYSRESAEEKTVTLLENGGNRSPDIPSFSANPSQAKVWEIIKYSWVISDPENNGMRCEVDLDSNGTIDRTFNNCNSGTTTDNSFGQPGIYNAKLIVTDDRGGRSEKTISVAVGTTNPSPIPPSPNPPSNTPPKILGFDAYPKQVQIPIDIPFNAFVTVGFSVTDADGDAVSCILETGFQSRPVSCSSNVSIQTTVKYFGLNGEIWNPQIRLVVRDSRGNETRSNPIGILLSQGGFESQTVLKIFYRCLVVGIPDFASSSGDSIITLPFTFMDTPVYSSFKLIPEAAELILEIARDTAKQDIQLGLFEQEFQRRWMSIERFATSPYGDFMAKILKGSGAVSFVGCLAKPPF